MNLISYFFIILWITLKIKIKTWKINLEIFLILLFYVIDLLSWTNKPTRMAEPPRQPREAKDLKGLLNFCMQATG